MNIRRILPKVGLAVGAVVVASGLCELAARAIFPAPPNGTRQPQIAYRTDPDIRYVLAPNQTGWVDDGRVSVNSLGFRGPEVDVPKPKGRFRIVVVGDSVAFGWGVGDEETFAAQLGSLLHDRFRETDTDIVNLSVAGYDTRQEVELLRRNVLRLDPDMVLVGFYSNDIPDALDDEEPSGSGGAVLSSAGREAGQILHINPTPSSWWNRQLRKSRVLYILGHVFRRLEGLRELGMELDTLQGKESPPIERAWQLVKKQFDELHTLAAEQSFSVGIVVLPAREQVLGQFPDATYRGRIRMLAAPLGFHVIDPLPLMVESRAKTKDELYIAYDRNHPSPAGHRVIAQAILRYFEDAHLVPGHRD